MKTKITILMIFFSSFTYSAFAQETPKHKWDIVGQIASPEEFTVPYSLLESYNEKDNSAFSLGLLGNYFVRDNVFIRFKTGMCNKKVTYHEENKDTAVAPIYVRDEIIRQNSKKIALGIGRGIEQKSVRIYTGIEMLATVYDKFNIDYHGTETTFGGYIETKSNIVPGGYAIGLGAFIGCQFVFLKRFAVGTEFSSAFQYYKVGGEDTYNNVIVGSPNYNITGHTLITRKYIGFSKINASISIAYSF